jgi:hypothetical protein
MATKIEKPKEATPLEIYTTGGKKYSSLVKALQSLTERPPTTATAAELKELLKKLCLSAQGSRYAIHLEQSELADFAQFLMVATEKEASATSLLKALTCSRNDFHVTFSAAIIEFLKAAKRVVPKLVTHIQKSRNPDSQVEAYASCEPKLTYGTLSSGLHTRSVTVTDAQIVGQRWFWEATAYVDGKHEQLISYVEKHPDLQWFWSGGNFDDLPLPSERFPNYVGALSHQLLFELASGEYVSLTPLTSISGLTQLAASNASDATWKRQRAAEYGGANARNIAAFMMDRSGVIKHPMNTPWIPPRNQKGITGFHLTRPEHLVAKAKLSKIVIESLFSEHNEAATNSNRRQRLMNILEPILTQTAAALIAARETHLEGKLTSADSASGHIYLKWIFAETPMRRSELEELAETILTKACGELRVLNFTRWNELSTLTSEWVTLL